MGKTIQTMAASLAHAAWTVTPAKIGGGIYNATECREAARALEAFPAMLAALQEAGDFLGCFGHRDGQRRGDMADRIRAAIAAATGGATGEAECAHDFAPDDVMIWTCRKCGLEGNEPAPPTGEAEAPAASPTVESGDDCEAIRTLEQAAACVRDGLVLLDTVDYVDDHALEDGRLCVVPAEGPAFRVAITMGER